MPLVLKQKEAADLLGVSPRTLRDWRAENSDFPDTSHGYNIDAIRAWRQEYERKGSEVSTRQSQLNVALKAMKIRQEKVRADRMEREEEVARGNILPREEYELAIREIITLTRDRLLGIPKQLCRFVPKKYHRQLQAEGGAEVRKILGEFARLIERGPVD